MGISPLILGSMLTSLGPLFAVVQDGCLPSLGRLFILSWTVISKDSLELVLILIIGRASSGPGSGPGRLARILAASTRSIADEQFEISSGVHRCPSYIISIITSRGAADFARTISRERSIGNILCFRTSASRTASYVLSQLLAAWHTLLFL